MKIKVNGDVIPEEAIQFELNRLMKYHSELTSRRQALEQIESLKRKAVDQAIGAKLLLMESARLDLPVDAKVLDRKLEKVVKDVGGRAKYEEMLKARGITEKHVMDGLVQGAKVERLMDKITEGVPDPTDREIMDHFRDHAAEYSKEPRVQARHILIKPDSNSEKDRDVARSKLLEIRNRIEEGADFADEAAAHSQCPSGKKMGGSLGWFSRGMMIPEFESAAFSMDVDELSDIIETQFGLHLIHKTAHDAGGEVTIADVSDKIRDFLRHVKRGEIIRAFVDELKKKANIEFVE